MIMTLTSHDFLREFANSGRAEQFSREALLTIFDLIEEYENDTNVQTELDIIAICCNWSEESYVEIARNYSIDISDLSDADAIETVLEFLRNNVSASQVSDKIVYEQF